MQKCLSRENRKIHENVAIVFPLLLIKIIENSRAKIIVVGAGGAGNNTISRLGEIGIEGAEIEDNIPLSEYEKSQMFVDILPENPNAGN